jgi:hypothetical protein
MRVKDEEKRWKGKTAGKGWESKEWEGKGWEWKGWREKIKRKDERGNGEGYRRGEGMRERIERGKKRVKLKDERGKDERGKDERAKDEWWKNEGKGTVV